MDERNVDEVLAKLLNRIDRLNDLLRHEVADEISKYKNCFEQVEDLIGDLDESIKP